jgi:RNA polymerase sigma-70 factor (ECF subfamily)
MSNTPDQRFTALVHPHLAVLYRAALRLTRRRHDAEDLTQEVCLRACGRLEELARTANPRAWLMRTLYHLFIDSTRRRRLRARFALFSGAADGSETAADDACSPERMADVSLMHERIGTVWVRLDPEQRALLSLHAEGHGLDELAVIFAINRNALSARLHRARSRLARLLASGAAGSTLAPAEDKP